LVQVLSERLRKGESSKIKHLQIKVDAFLFCRHTNGYLMFFMTVNQGPEGFRVFVSVNIIQLLPRSLPQFLFITTLPYVPTALKELPLPAMSIKVASRKRVNKVPIILKTIGTL
jgi:hypothetical protein